MRTYLYTFFWLLIFVGFALISFSFPRHELTRVGQLVVGAIVAIVGMWGSIVMDNVTKVDSQDNQDMPLF